MMLYRVTAIAAGLLLACPAPSVAQSRGTAPKRILLLHQGGVSAPIRGRFNEAFIEAVRSVPAAIPIDLYEEAIESGRFPGAAQSQVLRTYLKDKYANRTIDVVVTQGSAGLAFARRNRKVLGDPSIVALLYPEYRIAPSDNLTGLRGGYFINGTIDVALALRPDTEVMFVVDGVRDNNGELQAEVERQVKQRDRPVNLVYLRDLLLPELLTRVASVPDRSVVLFFRQTIGSRSQDVDELDALKEVLRVSRVPVFSQSEEYIGRGVLGGYMRRVEADARQMAEMTARIMSGTNPRDMPPLRSTYSILFDWRELQRWRIPEARLPQGSTVLFRPLSYFEQHGEFVIGGLLVFAAQLALIVGLIMERTRRLRAENEARRTREQLSHMTRVSTMSELAASLAHELNQPLMGILCNARAARHLVKAGHAGQPKVTEILQNIVDDNKRAGDVIVRMRELVTRHATERKRVDLNEVVQSVATIVASDAIIRQVVVRLALSPDELVVAGDRIQLQQVVLNLLLNALEATPVSNGVSQEIVVRTDLSDGRSVHVVVRDHGTGLRPGMEQRVFDPFYTTKGSGMGMGLSIARSILEAHGGRIWASGTVERGAEFHFTLPRMVIASARWTARRSA